MSFFENIKEFFSLLKESNYNLGTVYSQNPDNIHVVILILIIIAILIAFFIVNSFKRVQLLKLISEIEKSSNFLVFEEKLSKIANELPKRGVEVASKLNLSKNEIYEKGLFLIKNFNIKEKIEAYKSFSTTCSLIAKSSQKYKIDELSNFFEEKSIFLLEKNLFKEIENYYKTARFNEDDVELVNSIVAYSKNLSNPFSVLIPLQQEINKFSFTFNLDLFKFVKKLTKDSSGEIFVKLNEKLNNMFKDENEKISNVILSYVLKNDEKEKVYNYISNLKDKDYLQNLYFNFFGKSNDTDLDLAFIKNETKIKNDYKEYINCQITYNWKDLAYINYILNSPKVLQVIGHNDYRAIIERIEKLEKDIDFNAKVSRVLEIANDAKKIAKEAKAIARSK
ncbi:MAG: hypothetical protein RBQ84_05820 [Arcobacter sp.]|jgi:hypothetical protein|uniref:hypothetical protein n=1 Tax=Arcobacter sp. TaxID=1872629 RepID=UPI002A750FCD|nr:hypothetical protein [Arcobacter sp.]MDY3200454.1 hypothetical protein [Arcobacter sp.]